MEEARKYGVKETIYEIAMPTVFIVTRTKKINTL